MSARKRTDSLDLPDAPSNQTMFDMSGYLDTEELCTSFKRSIQTIYLWRTKKGLPHTVFQIGKKPAIRFLQNEVQAWALARNIEFTITDSE